MNTKIGEILSDMDDMIDRIAQIKRIDIDTREKIMSKINDATEIIRKYDPDYMLLGESK